MIKNEPEEVRNQSKRLENDKIRQFSYTRARSSSVGSSDEDTKVRYKNLFRKQSSFERPSNPSQNNINCDSLPGILPAILHQHNNISSLFTKQIPERKNSSLANVMNSESNVISEICDNKSSIINLPEILDESDEITILRHLIQLLSVKVNKLNDEKKQLYQHISTINQINHELVNIIQQRVQK